MVNQIRPLNKKRLQQNKKTSRKGSSCGFKKKINAGNYTSLAEPIRKNMDRTEILHTIKLKTPQCNVKTTKTTTTERHTDTET